MCINNPIQINAHEHMHTTGDETSAFMPHIFSISHAWIENITDGLP